MQVTQLTCDAEFATQDAWRDSFVQSLKSKGSSYTDKQWQMQFSEFCKSKRELDGKDDLSQSQSRI